MTSQCLAHSWCSRNADRIHPKDLSDATLKYAPSMAWEKRSSCSGPPNGMGSPVPAWPTGDSEEPCGYQCPHAEAVSGQQCICTEAILIYFTHSFLYMISRPNTMEACCEYPSWLGNCKIKVLYI